MMAFIPVVLMVQVLPIGISGLGVRETALVLFLHPLGVDNTQAIALGLALYFLNLTASLVGAPAFAFGGHAEPLPGMAPGIDPDIDPGADPQAVPAA
jgi:glycosyltransferase 2 family protein